MPKMNIHIVLLLAVAIHNSQCNLVATLGSAKIIDMTHVIDERTFVWPGNNNFSISEMIRGPFQVNPQAPTVWLYQNQFSVPEHSGTHMDAPSHFCENGTNLDQIPVESLVAPAVRVDTSEKAAKNRNYEVTVADLEDWERENGPFPNKSVLFLYYGWGKYYHNRTAYVGGPWYLDYRYENGTVKLSFPGLSNEAAKWIVKSGKFYGVGFDAPSLDYGPSDSFPSHITVQCEGNMYILENVANLDQLPKKGATVVISPMKIGEGSGGPTRIMAFVPTATEQDKSTTPATKTNCIETSGSMKLHTQTYLMVVTVVGVLYGCARI